MTLLTICQSVADTIPVEKPTVVYGSTNDTARLLVALAQKEGKILAKRHNWIALGKEHTFDTVNGTADYSLPSGYARLENNTVWDRANYWAMRGPLSPQAWQAYKSSVLGDTVTVRKRYRIRDVSGTVKFSIDPTPTSAEALVYEYISDQWCQSSGGTAQSAWAADTDTGILDEDLTALGVLWRALKRLGMEYADERVEYEREVEKAIARDGGAPILSVAHRDRTALIGPWNVPDTGFGS